MAAREFAKLQLNASKLIAGQGTVSDAERALLAQVAGSTSDDPKTIKDIILWGRERVKYDEKVGAAWTMYKDKFPGASYEDFKRGSPLYKQARQDFTTRMDEIGKSYLEKGINANQKEHPGKSLLNKYPSSRKTNP